MEWEIGAECLACVLIVLVLCFSREKFYTQMPQTRLYYACLGFALFSTLLNIATVVLMGVPGLLPRWLCYTLNMLYFTFFPLLEAALTYYMAYLIHGRGPCFTRVAICLGVMLAAALAVVFTNPFTGWLFYLDAAGTYVRGPYNRLLYALLVACCLLLVICYIKQFRTASRAIHRMMATLPLLAMVLGTVQYLFPPVMMTGFIPACILLVLFFNFQSQRINTDFLTGLSSRSALWYAAGTCLRSGQSFYCVAVCLRHFGDVNKQFGHTGGDAVLRQVSAYLEALGRRAVACRFSGVEFVLLFPGMDAAGYAVLEKELSERFAAPWQAGSVCCRLDAGVAGIACPRFGDTAERLTAHLEYAIQQMKLPGAPEALSFDTEMEQRFSRRVALRDVVVRTLSGQAAGVAYQPIYALDADTPCMAEALLRLCGADGKPVPTADVVSVAEEMDLIVALDWMMLEQVCAFFGAHRELDGCAVSVNFSARQFLAPDAERRVLDTLERSAEAGINGARVGRRYPACACRDGGFGRPGRGILSGRFRHRIFQSLQRGVSAAAVCEGGQKPFGSRDEWRRGSAFAARGGGNVPGHGPRHPAGGCGNAGAVCAGVHAACRPAAGILSGAPNAGRGALCSDAQRRAAHAQNLKRLWLQPLK